MTSEILYTGELRTKSTHIKSGTSIITDAPTDNHGKGETFSPTDLLASSLGQCMLTVMGIEAEKRGYNLNGARAKLSKVMGVNPRRVTKIRVIIELPLFTKDDLELKRMEDIGRNCPVAKSLSSEIIQDVSFNYIK